MKAVVRDRFGPPEVLHLLEVDTPTIGEDQVLIKVRAFSVNPADKYDIIGVSFPIRLIAARSGGVLKPKVPWVGTDLAGSVETVGGKVTNFKPGDDVFGTSPRAFAEFAPAREVRLSRKPPNVSFEEAAAVPIAGLTALQGLRDVGKLKAGQKVLINGASGGVGTFAIQIAKWMGAEVTGVCSPAHVETARSLGADHVIDYTKEDFARSGLGYDLILDIAGNRSISDIKRALSPDGVHVFVGARAHLLRTLLKFIVVARLRSMSGKKRTLFFIAKITPEDLNVMRELMETGAVKPFVDKQYSMDETADAVRYLAEGHAGGKIVVTTGSGV